jgi:hypothetical protein
MTSRFTYWLQEDRVRNQFFAGRGLFARRSPLEFLNRTLPPRVDSIAITRERLYYANGKGVFLATDPLPVFAPRG